MSSEKQTPELKDYGIEATFDGGSTSLGPEDVNWLSGETEVNLVRVSTINGSQYLFGSCIPQDSPFYDATGKLNEKQQLAADRGMYTAFMLLADGEMPTSVREENYIASSHIKKIEIPGQGRPRVLFKRMPNVDSNGVDTPVFIRLGVYRHSEQDKLLSKVETSGRKRKVHR